MKVEVKKVDQTKREIFVEETGELIKNKFEEVFKKVGEKAKVPGFRAGHIPRDILEKHFSAEVHHQVLNELIPALYDKAVEQEKLEALELPEVSDVKLERTLIAFKAEVEVMPEIPVKNYRNIAISYQVAKAGPDELKRSIDSLKESRKIESVDEGFARMLGYPDVATFESALEKQLLLTQQHNQRQKIENQIVEFLNKSHDFKLPQVLVKKQLEDSLRQTKVELMMKGIPKDKVEEQEKTLVEELEPEAKKQVKTYLILGAIAKKENIAVDNHMPQRVMEFLLKEADWKIEGK